MLRLKCFKILSSRTSTFVVNTSPSPYRRPVLNSLNSTLLNRSVTMPFFLPSTDIRKVDPDWARSHQMTMWAAGYSRVSTHPSLVSQDLPRPSRLAASSRSGPSRFFPDRNKYNVCCLLFSFMSTLLNKLTFIIDARLSSVRLSTN